MKRPFCLFLTLTLVIGQYSIASAQAQSQTPINPQLPLHKALATTTDKPSESRTDSAPDSSQGRREQASPQISPQVSPQDSATGYVAPKSTTVDEPMNPLTDLTQPTLRGTAQINTVSGQAFTITKCPLTKCRDHKLKFIELKVINNSQQVTFIDGDSTQAQIADDIGLRASTPRYLGKTAAKNLSLAQHLLIAGVSLTTCALAGPIAYEVINSSQYGKRYLGRAIGFDGVRHEIEGERFGLRMIMPQDESTGWLAFRDPGKRQLKNLIVPVSFTTERIPAGSLIIPIENQ